jgi:uncharacterized coiled-coil protein SlyX
LFEKNDSFKEINVSHMKNLFEQLIEKAGATHGFQVIQGNLDEILAQLKAEAGDVAEVVGKTATAAVDTGLNAVQQLIADLNAQFGGQEGVEINHRNLSSEELEAELIALMTGQGDYAGLEEDDRELQDLSREELYQLIQMQDETLELSQVALEHMREQAVEQAQRIQQLEATVDLQSQLLESSNAQLTSMHEGVAGLRGLLETLKSANGKLDTHTRTISFADILNGLAKR